MVSLVRAVVPKVLGNKSSVFMRIHMNNGGCWKAKITIIIKHVTYGKPKLFERSYCDCREETYKHLCRVTTNLTRGSNKKRNQRGSAMDKSKLETNTFKGFQGRENSCNRCKHCHARENERKPNYDWLWV